jgi:hypothetical protein
MEERTINHLIHLREEIAQIRLGDLAKEYGRNSWQVNNYKRRNGIYTIDFNKAPNLQRQTASNKAAVE